MDKAEGESSFGVVSKVRRALGGFKACKVGHSGTLDPFATGLLIILLGQGTKLSNFIMSGDKTYLATMRLGIETDTLDPTGRVVRTMAVPDLDQECISKKSQGFLGDIQQTPPLYSAVKSNGTRAYKLARKGMDVQLKKRTVAIHSFRILSVDLPDVTMEIMCSSGTYIRSLAADLGTKLGPGAHLKSLRRLASGSFKVEEAVCSKKISPGGMHELLEERLISLRSALPDMREVLIEEDLEKKVRSGYQPSWEEMTSRLKPAVCEDGHFKLTRGGELVAIVGVKNRKEGGHGTVRIKRVFS